MWMWDVVVIVIVVVAGRRGESGMRGQKEK